MDFAFAILALLVFLLVLAVLFMALRATENARFLTRLFAMSADLRLAALLAPPPAPAPPAPRPPVMRPRVRIQEPPSDDLLGGDPPEWSTEHAKDIGVVD